MGKQQCVMERSAPHMNNVVLADDDLDHAFLFSYVLKQVEPGKHLTHVRDGEELMRYLSEQVPDLLFLDLNMPCKHGFECLTEIRKDLKLNELPVVVYSSSTQMTDIQRSYVHQADLYMVKPFNATHLKHALVAILGLEWRNNYTDQKYYFMNNRFVPFTA